MLNVTVEQVLLNYNLRPQEITPILVGLINETHLVKASEGDFILQKMNAMYDLNTILKVSGVGKFLNARKLLAPLTVQTTKGQWGVEYGGRWWRLVTYIPGRVVEKVGGPAMAFEAGKILGQFHAVMQDYPDDLLEIRPIHDYVWNWVKFSIVASGKLEPEIELLRKVISDLPQLFLPGGLETSVTHGDPKVSNIIFEKLTDGAVALIDLDGCSRRNNVIVELGDAFRSWCGGYENDDQNRFNLERFRAGWNGYRDGRKESLTYTEQMSLPRAIKLIILELASRFLLDYFENQYFGWDAQRFSSRRAHNLARARGQVSLYQDFLQKERQVEKIVKMG